MEYKKIKKIAAVVALSLLPYLSNYAPASISTQQQNQNSALEEIVKNNEQEAQKNVDLSGYDLPIQNQNYLLNPYKKILRDYLQKHISEKEDMANRVPLKWLNILPETSMGGVLGFTYLGENFMARRADLTGKTARMVDIHESIHTPDEYETRVLTSWIMEKVRGKYIK